jgi:hypothetical protein
MGFMIGASPSFVRFALDMALILKGFAQLRC